MATQVSDNVRSLFVDLGISVERIGEPAGVVINRFDHWANRGDIQLAPTAICGTVTGDIIIGAA